MDNWNNILPSCLVNCIDWRIEDLCVNSGICSTLSVDFLLRISYNRIVTQSEKQPCVLRSAKNESVYKLKCSVNLLTIINVLKNKWVVSVFHPVLLQPLSWYSGMEYTCRFRTLVWVGESEKSCSPLDLNTGTVGTIGGTPVLVSLPYSISCIRVGS